MAASARVVDPTSTGARQPAVAELKKTQFKLPSLHLNSKAPFQLQTVDKATMLYGQYYAMDSDAKAAVETTDQLGISNYKYNTLIASSNSIKVVLRQALTKTLSQENSMLTYGIYTAKRMLFYTMRKNLPAKNFLKIAVVNAIETRLVKPKTFAECVNKIRTYIHDV
eukprot:3791390-Amphidinium_carterae.1